MFTFGQEHLKVKLDLGLHDGTCVFDSTKRLQFKAVAAKLQVALTELFVVFHTCCFLRLLTICELTLTES